MYAGEGKTGWGRGGQRGDGGIVYITRWEAQLVYASFNFSLNFWGERERRKKHTKKGMNKFANSCFAFVCHIKCHNQFGSRRKIMLRKRFILYVFLSC
mmetsp:Transcript_9627/g.14165  ORF Transcript_9627/g.14165 Transcript_9627/m.14165 type:complete len:98 (-) Transcript_9627:226-519(-)